MADFSDDDPPRSAQAPLPLGRQQWVADAVTAHERSLIGYATHLLGSAERGRDVVQEAFTRLCGQRPDAVMLPDWLFVVCRNLAIDRLRKERRMSVTNDSAIAELRSSDEASPSLRLVRADESRRLVDLLKTLPSRQQEAVRLKFQQDLSYAQIATTMNTTPNNVAVLVLTGLRTLRERMGA